MFDVEIKSGLVLIQLHSKGICGDGHMLCDWTEHTQSHWHTHTHKLHAIGQVHCVAIKWEPQRAWSVASFQPRCRLSDHFSEFLVQPFVVLGFYSSMEASLWSSWSPAAGESWVQKGWELRVEEQQLQFPCCHLHHCHCHSGLSSVAPTQSAYPAQLHLPAFYQWKVVASCNNSFHTLHVNQVGWCY